MIDISNHPIHGFVRKVNPDDVLVIIDGKNKFVRLQMDVLCYKDDVLIPEMTKLVTLTADNTTRVDETGTIVEGDGVMGEYDFFVYLQSQPIVINTIKAAKITWADSVGKL